MIVCEIIETVFLTAVAIVKCCINRFKHFVLSDYLYIMNTAIKYG